MSVVIVMLITTVWSLIVPSVRCDSESVVDLTHPLNSQTLHWVEARDFELKVVVNGTIRDGEHSYWYPIFVQLIEILWGFRFCWTEYVIYCQNIFWKFLLYISSFLINFWIYILCKFFLCKYYAKLILFSLRLYFQRESNWEQNIFKFKFKTNWQMSCQRYIALFSVFQMT